MALEATPASVATDGNLRITFVDDASNPVSVAALSAGDDITYSLTPSGFTHGITENNIDDPRLTLKQIFNRPGTSTETLALQYIWGDADDVAYSVLAEGTKGFLVVRYAVPNATAYTTGQKVDVITVLAGKQRRDAPTANGLFTISQNLYITDVTKNDQTLVV
jgi:hypothetical protein